MDCSLSSNLHMAGMEVLRKGLGWIVGDKERIKMYGETPSYQPPLPLLPSDKTSYGRYSCWRLTG
ncbi:predicted protein [Arabidopsis lyrata subsp. lyrata]|uniref:Predicted protein n=1 Tax=Arabidopsis lyrata subsp. lyrata TaxID=81972 RepID=D7MHU4_ARALL|nr:predicted protein [Arabidopsis lyrata subsp. lyrata]